MLERKDTHRSDQLRLLHQIHLGKTCHFDKIISSSKPKNPQASACSNYLLITIPFPSSTSTASSHQFDSRLHFTLPA